jgi:hypothetical protein
MHGATTAQKAGRSRRRERNQLLLHPLQLRMRPLQREVLDQNRLRQLVDGIGIARQPILQQRFGVRVLFGQLRSFNFAHEILRHLGFLRSHCTSPSIVGT